MTTPQPSDSQPSAPIPTTTPHELVNPPELAPAVGFAHAVAAGPGRTVYLGGQAGIHPDGTVDPKATWSSSSTWRWPTWSRR